MAGGIHRGRWNKKGHVGTILLLMCVFTPTLTSLQPSEELECPHGDYLNDQGICCNKCPPGFRLTEQCHAAGQRSICSRCPDGQYMDQINYSPNCMSCKRCRVKNEIQESQCQNDKNTICRCMKDYYKVPIDSTKYECHKCTQCKSNEKIKEHCTPESNTVCECLESYHRVDNVCVLCNNCTTECKHHCITLPTHKPPEDPPVVGIIAGVAAALLLLLGLVVFITYTATKWSTKKKLLKSSSQPSDASPDTCQILIQSEEPSNSTDRAVPSVQDQPSNLPDCVPLEIKIPDLIYMVLDLVPVLQVKQLVRYLGVKDSEIEQAELDHRSSREAHYQMLRVWAERGSRAGGGGRGGMLHWHLLQELMEELKKMHLGRAAEELGTKYGIQ